MTEQSSGHGPSNEQLLREENERLRATLGELRARVKEPEEIIRALRQGEVDALVVTEAQGERIYSLRSAEVLYRGMVEDMKDGAVALTPSGIIVFSNPYFARVVGADRGSLVGTSIFALIPDEGGPFFEVLRQESRNGASRAEVTLRTQDGRTIPVFATMNRIGMGDDEDAIFCLLLTDLTDQKRREELLTESRRKDEFLAMLAHELRNPLAPIRSAVQLLRLKGSPDPEAQWACEVIDRQLTQLIRLVDDLLDVSRITRGKIRLEMDLIDLTSAVTRAIEAAHPILEAHQHQLSLHLPPGPLRLQADSARLSQVVSNLLNNAAKFTPDGGHIWLTVTQTERDFFIIVRDAGIGIAADMLPRVFDLFTQADSTPERSHEGLGIGLTLVRSLVEMHGGSAEARSDGIGLGSEFIVRLPRPPEMQQETAPERRPKLASGSGCPPRRILVVDDNVDAANALAMLLQHWGHEVRTVHDGESALLEAPTFRPQLMFLDIGLPRMNGFEVARLLRRLPELDGMRLIALSGYGQEEDHRRSREAGFDQHWVKPLRPEALTELLEHLGTQAPTPS